MITGKESIQEKDKPSKRAKEDSITDVEKVVKKNLHRLKNKEDYIGDTNEKTRGSYDSPSETHGFPRNLDEEHENEEDEEFSENTSEINDSIKLKISKGITEEDVIISLLDKKILLKVIKAVI